MKKRLKDILKGGMFLTIGGYQIDTPIEPKWAGMLSLFKDVQGIVNLVIAFSSVVAVAMIIVSGYTLITSTGNPEKIEQGQKTLTGSVIGLAIVWVAGLLVKALLAILNVE